MKKMKLNEQTKKVIETVESWGLPSGEKCTVQDRRIGLTPYGYTSNAPIKEIKDVSISVSSGTIGVRFYMPNGTGPFPVFINIHGGGWVLGSISTDQGINRELCSQVPCIVVAIDYHLAPEHKFPTPFNDCYQAVQWIEKHCADYGGDPSKIVIGGMSAGGNLAAAVALKTRDEQHMPFLAQVLMMPVTNFNFDTDSYKENAKGYVLTTELMKSNWHNYLVTEADGSNPYASPLQAASHKNLPPTLMILAEFDPLRDDGTQYTKVLEASGVPVTQKIYPTIHAFTSMADRIDLAKEATVVMADYLRDSFVG